MSLAVNQLISINGVTYRVLPFPMNAGVPFCIEAGQADVCKVIDTANGNSLALKIFHKGKTTPHT